MVSELAYPRQEPVGNDWVGNSVSVKSPNPFRPVAADYGGDFVLQFRTAIHRRWQRLRAQALLRPAAHPRLIRSPTRPYSSSGFGGGNDQCMVKVPDIDPGKIPKPASISGKMTKSMVRYEADASDPTAVWRVVHLRPSEEPRELPDQAPPDELEIEKTRNVEDLRQSNMDSTQGFRLNGTPEGNFNFPLSKGVVVTGWGEDLLPHAFVASPTLNNLTPNSDPESARQCSQLNLTGVVEIPEENSSGVVWDDNNVNCKEDNMSLDNESDQELTSALRVGQRCLAMGNPFGVDHTLTVGVFSDLNRDIFSKAGVTIEDGAHVHLKQSAFLYNFNAQTLPKSYHCPSRRLMLEYSKFSSLDSDEPFACKFNNPKHRDTYKQVIVHVLNYEVIMWEKLPKFSMQQLYFVGLLWNIPPWPDLSFCEVYWMAKGMQKEFYGLQDLGEDEPIGLTEVEISQLSISASRCGVKNRRAGVSLDRIQSCEEFATRSAYKLHGDKDNAVRECEANVRRYKERLSSDASCCVCGISKLEPCYQLLECSKCYIKVHQACCGALKAPRIFKAQNILKSLLKGFTIAARSDEYIHSSVNASNECSSNLHGEDIKYDSYALRLTSWNTVSTIDLQKPIDIAHEEIENVDLKHHGAGGASLSSQYLDFLVKLNNDQEHLFRNIQRNLCYNLFRLISGKPLRILNMEIGTKDMDMRCLYLQKSLLKSGTLGARCNIQVVIPHLTGNYGTIRGKISKEILNEFITKGRTVNSMMEERDLVQIADPAAIEAMDKKNNLCNISVIAHVDHGKSTLIDPLVAAAGITVQEVAGDVSKTDTRVDETKRGITVKSTGNSLFYEITEESLKSYKSEGLWGENFSDPNTKKWTTMNTGSATCMRGFVQFCHEPIKQIIKTCINYQKDKWWPMLRKLGVTLKTDEKELMGKALMKRVMQIWLPVSNALLGMVIFHIPTPSKAQKYLVENLYEGSLDDIYATDIRNCNLEGSFMLNISKMIPASNKGRPFAFGRVFSRKVAIDKKDLYVKSVQRTDIWMGKTQESVEDVPCVNTVAMVGLDLFITKNETLTNEKEVDACLSVFPVVNVAVQCKFTSDFSQLVDSLKVASDPMVFCIMEDPDESIYSNIRHTKDFQVITLNVFSDTHSKTVVESPGPRSWKNIFFKEPGVILEDVGFCDTHMVLILRQGRKCRLCSILCGPNYDYYSSTMRFTISPVGRPDAVIDDNLLYGNAFATIAARLSSNKADLSSEGFGGCNWNELNEYCACEYYYAPSKDEVLNPLTLVYSQKHKQEENPGLLHGPGAYGKKRHQDGARPKQMHSAYDVVSSGEVLFEKEKGVKAVMPNESTYSDFFFGSSNRKRCQILSLEICCDWGFLIFHSLTCLARYHPHSNLQILIQLVLYYNHFSGSVPIFGQHVLANITGFLISILEDKYAVEGEALSEPAIWRS